MTIRIPYAPLKVIFFIHLVLIVWASQSRWLPDSYLGYNGLLLLTILWTIHSRDSEEGPFMGICVNAVSVLLDIVSLAVFWPAGANSGLQWFGGLCAVVQLLTRPVSSYMMYRILQDRAATYGNFTLPAGLENILPSNLGGGGGVSRSPYEDIDQPATINTQTLAPQGPESSSSIQGLQPQQTYQASKPQHDPLGFGSS